MAEKPHIPTTADFADDDLVDLAIYDFDGTLLDGKSPVLLTQYLIKTKRMSFLQGLAIGLWGLAYKMHVPPNEAWVRGRVFMPFDGMPKKDVDQFLYWFFDRKLRDRLRASLLKRIEDDRASGCVVITVSASFEPIVQRMVNLGIVDGQVSTRMQVDKRGNYIARVEGLPVEGDEKLAGLKRYADERFGEGCWRIRYAYSDHYSDKPLLHAADTAFAVHPDHGLREAARKNGWQILED